jgi:hypothetical protein
VSDVRDMLRRCREHGVAHFHATYAGKTAVVAIETGEVIAGPVPARACEQAPREPNRAAGVASASWISPHICTA